MNVYTPGRDGAGFITNVDENCTLQDFIYDKDRKGNHLNEKPEDGHATYEIIPFYSTYIDVKPGTMDPAISNPVLKYYFDGAFNPYAG
ncbi:MAG: hypothetical protein Q4F54_05245 [Coriobacteriia bacterium]|nr:hypothetical protein [Coriobacteriia bacterium]